MASPHQRRTGRVWALTLAGLLTFGAVGCDGGETEQIGNLDIDLTEPGSDSGAGTGEAAQG